MHRPGERWPALGATMSRRFDLLRRSDREAAYWREWLRELRTNIGEPGPLKSLSALTLQEAVAGMRKRSKQARGEGDTEAADRLEAMAIVTGAELERRRAEATWRAAS